MTAFIFNTLSIFLSLLMLPSLAGAADVTAIKSIDIIPYKEAVNGFRDTVKARVHEYVLMDEKGMDNSVVLRIKAQKTDLIFTLGTDAFQMVKEEFKDTPIIYAFVLNPEKIVGNRAADITGIDMSIPPERQFSALMDMLPSARRIGVIFDPAKSQGLVDDAEAAARDLGITLTAKRITRSSDAIVAITEMEEKIDALWMIPDTTAVTPESVENMLLFSFKSGIPLIGISDKYVRNGALFALSFDNEDIGRQAGEMASRILSGESISTMTMLKPRKLRMSINMNTAKKLGLNIPERVVSKSDKVYR